MISHIKIILVIHKIRHPSTSYLSIRNNLIYKNLIFIKPIQYNKSSFVHSQLCLVKQLHYTIITHVYILEIRYVIYVTYERMITT